MINSQIMFYIRGFLKDNMMGIWIYSPKIIINQVVYFEKRRDSIKDTMVIMDHLF